MRAHDFVIALAIVSPALTIMRGVPQAIRIHHEGAAGVSVGTWLFSIWVAELWIGYGLIFHVTAEIAANVPNLILATLVVGSVAKRRGSVVADISAMAIITLGATGLAVSSEVVHEHWVLSIPAVLASLVFFLPQMMKVLREQELLGVSIATWFLALLTAVSWGLYGLLIHQASIAIPSAIMIPSSLVIVLRVVRTRPAIAKAT